MEKIRQYWDQRAQESKGSPTATTNDVYLRTLETDTLVQEIAALGLAPGSRVLDVGCGDGRTLGELSQRFPSLRFHGVDYSAEMVNIAQAQRGKENLTFSIGDATDLEGCLKGAEYSVILTNRCLINLQSPDDQYNSLRQIARHLTPGGSYLGTENFTAGQASLNALRKDVGLPEIPVRWHNLFFAEADFIDITRGFFSKVELVCFSSTYYLITRVVYSALCKRNGVEPDYMDPIHEIALSLPATGDFSPIKLVRARK